VGKLSRAANANSNSGGMGKYDNNLSGSAYKIFITGGKEQESMEKEGKADSNNLPAWQRYISGLSPGGKPRHPRGAEHGHLTDKQTKEAK